MKKVKLDVETLAVESFGIAAAVEDDGTIQGFAAPTPPYASCGCTTGASFLEAFCPPPSTRTTCAD